MVQIRHHKEVFMTFQEGAWTSERDGFLDAVFSNAIRRAGVHSYEYPFAPSTPPAVEEFDTFARAHITTITPTNGGGGVRVGIVAEGWVDEDALGES